MILFINGWSRNIQNFDSDADLRIIFEELTTNINLHDINFQIINNKLHFDKLHLKMTFKNCIKSTENRELQKAFNDKNFLLCDIQRN